MLFPLGATQAATQEKEGESEQERGGTFPVYKPALKGGVGCVMLGERNIALGA